MAGIDDYLKDLGAQNFTEEKLVQIAENPIIKKISSAYEKFLSEFSSRNDEIRYRSACDLARKLDCSAKNVKEFSILLKKYEGCEGFNWSGIFLSALINRSDDTDFEVFSKHLTGDSSNTGLSGIGYKNSKNVIVVGDVFSDVGTFMKSGKLIVKENSKFEVGSDMQGGEIIIEGTASGSIGNLMQNGHIIVKGALTPWDEPTNITNVGYELSGGLIEVKGVAFDLGNRQKGGKIILDGNVKNDTGRDMTGGEILITGSVDVSIGMYMKKGKITVNGNANYHLGLDAEGGEIYIGGEIKEKIRDHCKAKIYHKGELVWPK